MQDLVIMVHGISAALIPSLWGEKFNQNTKFVPLPV